LPCDFTETSSEITNTLFFFEIRIESLSKLGIIKITGVSVIVNTSMNVMGEPIVNTPEQAHNMLLKTDMDYLVMGNFLISGNYL